jgi:Bacterial capsule synthesis protein PGA_cap
VEAAAAGSVRAVRAGSLALGLLAVLLLPALAQAQTPAISLSGPRLVALGAPIDLRGSGVQPDAIVRLEVRAGRRWAPLARARANDAGRFSRTLRSRHMRGRTVLRAVSATGERSRRLVVRARAVTLAAVGDVNLGDAPGAVMAARGLRHPWTGVAGALRRPDIAFGNLECAVSRRGRPVPKAFTFRGRPAALRAMARFAGFDVLNLANNHVGDYGTAALLDTVKNVRRFGMTAVGAGRNVASAGRPRVVERLGLRVAFVGFSDILPASFFATASRPGTRAASMPAIRAGVRAARRRADVVIATFHWGVERAGSENGRQRAFASAALRAGAAAVIGAHPHVLQPIRRRGRKLVSYSLGNFVFGASSPATTRTGILRLRLSARGVEGSRLRPAVIEDTRPRLLRGR